MLAVCPWNLVCTEGITIPTLQSVFFSIYFRCPGQIETGTVSLQCCVPYCVLFISYLPWHLLGPVWMCPVTGHSHPQTFVPPIDCGLGDPVTGIWWHSGIMWFMMDVICSDCEKESGMTDFKGLSHCLELLVSKRGMLKWAEVWVQLFRQGAPIPITRPNCACAPVWGVLREPQLPEVIEQGIQDIFVCFKRLNKLVSLYVLTHLV